MGNHMHIIVKSLFSGGKSFEKFLQLVANCILLNIPTLLLAHFEGCHGLFMGEQQRGIMTLGGIFGKMSLVRGNGVRGERELGGVI